MRQITYNSQRNNIDFAGKFPAFHQCFSTCSFMLMSYYTDQIEGSDDEMLSRYLDDVEASIGTAGIAEKIKQKYKWITGDTSYWWLVQKAGIEEWLWRQGVGGQCVFNDGGLPISSLPEILKNAPVILQTNKMGGLPGGHIVLAVDFDSESNSLIMNDPFGNARTRYVSDDGADVPYFLPWLIPFITMNPECCRALYYELV